MIIYNKTCRGYSHIKNDKVCQDFSALYKDSNRIIITTCDGHGGNIYIRSDQGSLFASNALMNVLKNISIKQIENYDKNDLVNLIKIQLLCEWNKYVFEQLNAKPFTEEELNALSDEEKERLNENPVIAYGTTMIGSMLINNKLVVVKIGDGDALLIKDGTIQNAIEEEDTLVGNITNSMCLDDAYNHLNVSIVDFDNYDGILLCTDGFINPFQSYTNFTEYVINPLVTNFKENKITEFDNFVSKLATETGIGDDVSVSLILKN